MVAWSHGRTVAWSHGRIVALSHCRIVAPPVVKPIISVSATDPDASEAAAGGGGRGGRGGGGGTDIGVLEITRSGSTAAPFTVAVAMAGSATNGVDYGLVPGSVTFAAGQSVILVQITPVADVLVEGAETATLNIVPNSAYDITAPGSATVTIADEPVAPVLPAVTVAATDADASEVALDPATFTVTRTGSTAAALAVSVSIGGTATNGVDYSTIGATVTIAAGQLTAVVPVSPLADALAEGAETVIMSVVANAAYTTGSPSSATVSIADAGTPVVLPQVSVVATDAAASEVGPDNDVITVSRTGLPMGALVVNVAWSGTAVNGTDYPQLPSTVTIPAGAGSATVTLVPITDALVEGAETVVMTVSAGTAYDVAAPSTATVTIADAGAPVVKQL
ncbi:MAG: hypothetical protein H7Z40_22815 [Phycisphaerae bacterium]|nr:hypothetical protein [Gemmatimonadaceae bacterium]